MRLTVLVGVAWLGTACASPRAVAPMTTTPPRAVATQPPPQARAVRPAGSSRDHTLDVDELPAAFAELSPRDRERWHACHIFFLGQRDGSAPRGLEIPEPGQRPRPPAQQHLSFRVTPAQYVDTPEPARREFLIHHGCPDSLVDLADGTHLDMIHP